MKAFNFTAVMLLVLGMAGCHSQQPVEAATPEMCGTERWLVKTLQDKTANQIDPTPKKATVKFLASSPHPKHLPPMTRLTGYETTTWKVSGKIYGFKIEQGKTGDKDMHIVFEDADDPNVTMIVEVPDPACAPPRYSEQFRKIRDAVLKLGHPHGSTFLVLPKPVPVTFIGVGFYDKIHGQDGVAPNGAELHPALEAEFN